VRVFLLIVLTGVSASLSAQVKSRLGRFEVDYIKGCAPFTINITNTNLLTTGECTAGKPCIMTFEGTTQQQNTFQYTYNTPGTYKITVLYQSIGADDITVTVDQAIQPPFEIHRCSSDDVSIKVVDNNYEQYVINFGDATPEVAIPFSNNAVAQHTYAVAGTYNIQVRGRDSDPNAADNCPSKQESFTSLATLPNPSITKITAVSSTAVKIDLTTTNHIAYKLEIGTNNGTTFQVLQNAYQVTSIDVSNLLLDNNYYCFRLSAFDPCTNTNQYSNTVCTQDFDVTFDNAINRLTWRTATAGVASVAILRKDVSANLSQTTTLPGAPLSYNDQDYDCNVEYCYELTVNYGGGATSTSLQKCGVGKLITTHPAVDNVTGTIGTGGAELSWTIDPAIKTDHTDILRSTGNSVPVILANITAETYTDPTYTTEGAHCYEIRYVDLCGNYSGEGVLVCPMRLTGSISATNVVTLNWTKYKGWKSGVSNYSVEKFDKNNVLVKTFSVNLDTFLVDDQPDLTNQVVTYHVRAAPVTGTKNAYSNSVTFTKEVNLTFPTAFTPNADNLNDVFLVTGQFVDKMNIRIFDRWGILVFASDSSEPWNGTRDGIPMPESSYVWRAEIRDLAGRSISREGTLILIRN
jgi:gliding motility-associated-like protein